MVSSGALYVSEVHFEKVVGAGTEAALELIRPRCGQISHIRPREAVKNVVITA